MAAMRCDEWQRKENCGNGCTAKAKPEVIKALNLVREGYGKEEDKEANLTPKAKAETVLLEIREAAYDD